MASLRSFNDFVTRAGNGFYAKEPFRVEQSVNTVALKGSSIKSVQVSPCIHKLPSLPSGVTGYRLVSGTLQCQLAGTFYLVRLINMGDLDISTNVFTAGSAMPTRTEGNVSTQTSGGVILQTPTGLSAVPGSMTSTYIDQNGNAAEATAAITLTANAVAGSAVYMAFNGTDFAARQITTASRTGGTTPTGIVRHWGVDGIGGATIIAPGHAAQFNFLTANPSPPLFGAGDEFYIITENSLNARHLHGSLTFIAEQA